MATDARQFLTAMAILDRVIEKFERATYQSSHETRMMHELMDVRVLLTSACVPGQFKPESELKLYRDEVKE